MERPIPLKDIDYLLRRNWFLDYDSLIHVLWLADEESWEWIVANRKRYTENIQEVICVEAQLEFPSSNIRVRDFPDAEYEKMLIKNEDALSQQNEKNWVSYKKLYDISRPEADIDLECEEIYNKIQEQLQLTKNKRTIPPEVQNKVKVLQNEFEKLKTRIQQEDKDWEYLTKTDLILNGTLSKMQKEIDCGTDV